MVLSAFLAGALSQQCNFQGRCEGTDLAFASLDTPELCLQFCQQEPGCNYYTHDSNGDFCFAFETCDEVEDAVRSKAC